MASSAPPLLARQLVIDLSSSSDDDEQLSAPMQPASPRNTYPLRTRNAASPEQGNAQAALRHAEPHIFDNFVDLNEDATPDIYPADDATVPSADRNALQHQNRNGEVIIIDDEEVFIPDESPEPEKPPPPHNHAHADSDHTLAAALQMEEFTVETCLQRILAIFPDIQHEHVRTLYGAFDMSLLGPDRLERIIDKLLSGKSYPKQERITLKKRKRDADDDGEDKCWERTNREARPAACKVLMLAMLKADFPEIPHRRISQELHKHTHFYQTYTALAEAKDTSEDHQKWRGRASVKNLADADTIAANSGFATLVEELIAARRKVESVRELRKADEEKKRAEHENLQRAMEAGQVAECQACFEELPMNRQAHCDGDTAHFTCFDCLTTYIKSEVGQSRCAVLCTAGCGAPFAYSQLGRLEDRPLIEKLEQLQQEKAIRDAGIDDLEECPFCDYKAILPPIDVDFEFRCQNPECEKVSCRRCKAVSHIPISCEEHAKDNKLNNRHKIEEAMTAALVRACNKCKKQFIKEYGCNKMSCPSCGNLQCYVCSKSLANYDHFDQAGPGAHLRASKCPLYDNVEERHDREVKEAEEAARRQIMDEHPDVDETDLEIKVSDAVKKATQDRIRRGNPHGGAPFGFPGLYNGYRFGQHLGLHPADVDEDPDDDPDDDDFDNDTDDDDQVLGDPNRINLNGIDRQVPQLPGRLAIRGRLGNNDGAVYVGPPALPLFPQQQAQQPAVPNNNRAFGFQGYIPVLGFHRPAYQHGNLGRPAPQEPARFGGRALGMPARAFPSAPAITHAPNAPNFPFPVNDLGFPGARFHTPRAVNYPPVFGFGQLPQYGQWPQHQPAAMPAQPQAQAAAEHEQYAGQRHEHLDHQRIPQMQRRHMQIVGGVQNAGLLMQHHQAQHVAGDNRGIPDGDLFDDDGWPRNLF